VTVTSSQRTANSRFRAVLNRYPQETISNTVALHNPVKTAMQSRLIPDEFWFVCSKAKRHLV